MFELIESERILFLLGNKKGLQYRGRKDTLMKKNNVVSIEGREDSAPKPRGVLDELVREGAELVNDFETPIFIN